MICLLYFYVLLSTLLTPALFLSVVSQYKSLFPIFVPGIGIFGASELNYELLYPPLLDMGLLL
jgi:hypothetical protein